MPDVFKFPNDGYEVKVVRKEDIINTINENIIDKEVALALVTRCEIDATNFLREGRWAGIPFMGNIRITHTMKALMSEETKSVLEEAKENLDANKFILFRRAYCNDIGKHVKIERYYKYVVSKFVGKNQNFFNIISRRKGDKFARALCYTLIEPTVVEGDNEK